MGILKNYRKRGSERRAPKAVRQYKRLRAQYDAALTTDENRRHWQYADSASADAATSASERQTLRERARYEVGNNSYAKGISETLANYTIGTGPRLQALTDSQQLNRQIEQDFMAWAGAVDLAEKLRLLRKARVTDGEAFAGLVLNPGLAHDVQVDLNLIAAERVTDPRFNLTQSRSVDGINYDAYGNPASYRILNETGAADFFGLRQKVTVWPASNVAHYFRAERLGQQRGIPDITPALPLFAMLRRFTLAVIAAAESAANFAGILYSEAPSYEETADLNPLETIELERNMLLTVPAGWKLGQLKAEQPTTTYPTFTEKILNEIARAVGVPYGIAIGNSAGFNYASGRLDYQSFFKQLRIEQDFIEKRVLLPLLRQWFKSYVLLAPAAGYYLNRGGVVAHQWFWDGVEHVDPAKEAGAQATRLANNTTTLAIEYGRQGRDYEEQLRQRAKELALLKELGLTTPEAAPEVVEDAPEEEPANAEA